VRGINTELDPEVDIDPFIDTANEIVTEVCTDSGYTDTRLELIERWLATHLATVNDPRLVREEVSTLRLVYQQEVKLGLDQTPYGQQAKVIDTAGNLAKLDQMSKGKVSGTKKIVWLGKAED
jgi:hypothetical protein